jgi:pyridoxine 5'-phosphate synthase PdxJ
MLEDLKLFMDEKRIQFEAAREEAVSEVNYYTGALSTLDDLSEKFFPKAPEEPETPETPEAPKEEPKESDEETEDAEEAEDEEEPKSELKECSTNCKC